MALIESELEIVPIEKLLSIKMVLPSYQRPYRWSVKSCNTLFIDTYEAFKNNIEEYRLGSVIFQKYTSSENGDELYNIVDGQQRLTTISILLVCLSYDKLSLLEQEYSELSNNAIVVNYNILSRRVNELSEEERNQYKHYLLTQCKIVKIVTDNEQEAFQFFDSQNSRGKELAPHDLLKSYHLREMNDEDEIQKIKIINHWENINQRDLSILFKNYLYPLTRWYKRNGGLGYSSKRIDVFKGIKRNNTSNFAIYHKASNLYVEQMNINGINELISSNKLNQFQLTQPVIAGKRFFNYTRHYNQLLESIQTEIKQFHDKEGIEIPNLGSGDRYIKQLYESSLLFYADRFGIDSLTPSVMRFFYTWSYSLRLVMKAVYLQTINKYAMGWHDRVNYGLDIFRLISEMSEPEELKLITLNKPNINDNNKSKYETAYTLICEWNGWQ